MITQHKKAIAMKSLKAVVLLTTLLATNLFAATSVKVFSFDEGPIATNISRPRIYIQNTGTTTLTDFVYYYYFTTEDSKTPMFEDWYSPECDISLEQLSSNQYRLKYHVTGANFAPGQLLPDASGNVVGLHYNDWGTWDKTNDYSYNSSSTFTENTRIPVYVNGALVSGTEPSGSGGAITREVWYASGTSVSSIPVTTPFSSTGTLPNFDEPQNWADNFGTRLRGYITPTIGGTYYFWIAGDDNCELRLSSNDRPENKNTIASVPGWTGYQEWYKYSSQQKSAAITLVAGQRYYIEALHKEGSGGDNMTVGWTMPGGNTNGPPTVIPGSVLTPFVAPNATPTLTASLASPTQINLSWSDNCTNEDGYRVERSVSGGAYSQIADLPPDTTSFQNTGLTSSTAYSYRVRAYNSQGTSAYSNVFTLTTQEATSGVVVREVWLNVSGTAVSAIQTNTTPSLTTTMTTNLREPTNIADNFGTRIRGYIQAPTSGSYTFWISSDDNSEMWLSTDNQPAHKAKIDSVIGWTDTLQWNKYPSQKSNTKNLTAGAKYYFEILHKEGSGGDNLAVGWQKPNSGGTIEVIPASVLWKFVAPVTPSNLAAVAVSGTQINLTWSDNSDNEDNFLVEQSTDGVNFTQIASKSSNTTSYSVTGLVPATAYTFRVRAINSAGNSDYSQTATVPTQSTTAGAISRQVWYNVNTCNVGSIQVNTAPASEGTLSLFREPMNFSDHFGTRVRGYLTAPENGNYTFWISGDDDCVLKLSTSENPADTARIAYFTGWTDTLQWNKFPLTQKSNPINLVAGKRYYIEVLHVDGSGNDHMAVGWAKPSDGLAAQPQVIPGSVLSTFEAPAAPSSLTATPISSTQIDVSWTDKSDNETGFLIERALGNQQNFTQVGMVGPGVTSYACTGLDPNTQYQFRVRATNYAGNSAYTPNVQGVTGPTGDQGGPELTPQLLSFAIYSQDTTLVKNQSVFSGSGAVGSNTLVQVELDAVIGGNIVSGGNVLLKDRVKVQGDVTCAGTLSTVESAPPTISGTITEHASVTNVVIPVKPEIVCGTTNVTVSSGESINLMPGSYQDLTINPGATVTFTQGVYNFRTFTIGNDATALFSVPMDKTIEINIETSLNLLDRATAKFKDKGYAPCVKIYTNAYSITTGTNVNLSGIITAPNAAVSINSRDNINGAIYAKSVSLEPGAVVVSNCVNPDADDDGDGVPNLTEMMMNDPPDNGSIYTLVAVPVPALINNSMDQTVYYDFGRKLTQYTDARNVPVTYPAGSLANENIAPAFIMSNKPQHGIREFDLPGYNPVGNYLSMTANSLKSGESMQMTMPLFTNALPVVSSKIAYFNTSTNEWKIAEKAIWQTSLLTTSTSKMAITADAAPQQDASPELPDQRGQPFTIYDASAVIVVENYLNATAYLDDNETFSNSPILAFETHFNLTGATAAHVSVNYTEYPSGVPDGIVKPPVNFDLTLDSKTNALVSSNHFEFTNPIKVNSLVVEIENDGTSRLYWLTEEFSVLPGQTLDFHLDKSVDDLFSTTYKGDRISALYDGSALTFESMPFAEGVIKQSGSSWSHQFYLRDHLGSTRMVIDDNDEAVNAAMYQPYGTIDELKSSPEVVRERFTGKEFDEEGNANGAGGISAYYFGARMYDPETGIFQSADPAEQFFNSYAYGINPTNSTDPTGMYFTDLDDNISDWYYSPGSWQRDAFEQYLFDSDPHSFGSFQNYLSIEGARRDLSSYENGLNIANATSYQAAQDWSYVNTTADNLEGLGTLGFLYARFLQGNTWETTSHFTEWSKTSGDIIGSTSIGGWVEPTSTENSIKSENKYLSYDISQLYKTQPYTYSDIVKNISNSITKNGFDLNSPVVVYVDNGKALVVDGHHRLQAAQDASYVRVPIEYIHENQIYNIYGRRLEELRAMSHK